MSVLETKVQDCLVNLRDKKNIEPLKKLFLTHLNYDRANKPISTRSIKDSVREKFVDDPTVLAESSESGEFKIIYTPLRQLSKVDERAIVEQLLPYHPYSLFVFSNRDKSDWRFLNIKHERDENRRVLHRRITIGQNDRLRTATERIALLDLATLDSKSPLAIQQQHDRAFDVEAVTNKFFEEYKRVFEQVERQISGITNPDAKRLFAQKLFNRLMFIAFIEKKGWLEFGGRTDYLDALWEDYLLSNPRLLEEVGDLGSNFYRDRLSYLFFYGLNNHQEQDIANINGGGFLKQIIGKVPFLNGGLFEQEPDESNEKIFIPDGAIELIFTDLFARFNFTVSESTPLDEEVAVDPEMLGKVFEELCNSRHDSGSYYTPKPIVSFMCREALKGYLNSKVEKGKEDIIAKFVDDRDASQLRDPEAILKALKEVTVCDPACGSVAYLLGMLHELLDLRECLFSSKKIGSKLVYDRKLEIIEHNLYGVDKEQFAINIARLRLWLSLAVDSQEDKPEPLPNLKYKLEVGDSLLAPIAMAQLSARDVLIPEYRELKAKYINEHYGSQKKELVAEIEKIKSNIATLTHGNNSSNTGFDWAVEFADVMADGGFDIQIANPPYGATVDDNTRDLYFDRKVEGAQSKDTYGLFLARGLQLLKSGGQLCYIVSDTWRTIKSHRPLRKRFLDDTTISHFIDLPAWIFDATVNTCIFTATKNKPTTEHNLIAADLRNIKSGDWYSLTKNLDAIGNLDRDVQPLNYARYTYPQALISTYENLSFFIASPTLYKLLSDSKFKKLGSLADVKVGLQTGDNEYYLRKRMGVRGSYSILDESKLLTDRDIAKLTSDEKLHGVDPAKYGGRHFLPYDKGGESDTDEGWLPNYYVPTQYFIDWSKSAVDRLRTATRADVKHRKGQENKIKSADYDNVASRFQNSEYYFREGLTFSRTGVYSPTFRLGSCSAFDTEGSSIFSNDIPARVMLALLSSTFCKYILKTVVNHTVHAQIEDIKEFFISNINDTLKGRLEMLVAKIITKQKSNLRYQYHLHEQKEINAIVYQLYGLSEDDIREVEIWYCRRYSKLAEAQGMMDEIAEKYHNYLSLCEGNFALSEANSQNEELAVVTV